MKRGMVFTLLLIPSLLIHAVPAGAQWLHGWSHRRPVKINNPCGYELSDYPVRVILEDSLVFAGAENDGRDIRFTKDDLTTPIPFWIEAWDSVRNKAGIWVAVPSIPPDGAIICLYYGNPSATSESDGHATFDLYDGFEDYSTIHPGQWTRYEGNPLITEGDPGSWDDHGATFASVIWDSTAGEFRMYYHGFSFGGTHQVGLATSPDALNWTKHPGNPILTPTPTAWDRHSVRVPMVWKEGPEEYHMIYTGYDGSNYQVGYAYSSDGIVWEKHASNPVFNDPTWAHDSTENWGVIKVGSEYLMWYCNFGMRESGVAVSADLVNWSAYQIDPVFASSGDPNDDRYSQYCPFSFKHGDDFYLLVPSYSGGWNYSKYYLYRSPNPYFLESDRELVRIAHTVGRDGQWDDHDNDTPFVITLDIERTDFYNDELWCFYASEGGANLWKEGLLIESDIAEALTEAPTSNFGSWFTQGVITVEDSTVRQGLLSVRQHDEYDPGATRMWRIFSPAEMGAVGAWMRRNSTSYGDYDIYLYQDSTATGDSALACVAGLGRDGDFHYWDGEFHPTGVPWTVDTWFLVTLTFNTTSELYDFVVLDEDFMELVRVEDIAFGDSASYIDKAMLYTSMHFIEDGYADDFRIRKWCGAEPVAIVVSIHDQSGLPGRSVLHQNYPNPFNPVTRIRYDLSAPCHVRLDIYDVLGRKITTLVDEYQEAGDKIARWDGKDDKGDSIASGIYFYRLKAGAFSETRKMVLLK